MSQYVWDHAISSGSVPILGMGIRDKSYKFTGIIFALSLLVTNVCNFSVSCDMLSTATPVVCHHI